MRTVAIDSETTGVDLEHASRPYFVTTCDDEGDVVNFQWPVDPLTRRVRYVEEDWIRLAEMIKGADRLVLHNAGFDAHALAVGDPTGEVMKAWDWTKVDDTILAAHVVNSSHIQSPKALDKLTSEYVEWDISPFERNLEEACKAARRLARSKLKEWKIAEEGGEGMPSAKGGGDKAAKGVESDSPWKADGWLPRAVCLYAQGQAAEWRARPPEPPNPRRKAPPRDPWFVEYAEPDHPWLTVLEEYATKDGEATMVLWPRLEAILRSRGHWAHYQERRKILPIKYRIETWGVTFSEQRLGELEHEYRSESERAGRVCVGVAAGMGYELKLPKTGNNHSLTGFVFGLADRETGQWRPGPLGLPVVRETEKGGPSFDKYAVEIYQATLPPRSKALLFVNNLADKRKRDTQLSYMEGYRRFAKPLTEDSYAHRGEPVSTGDEKVSSQGDVDSDLLGVDGRPIRGGVRPVFSSGGVSGSPSQLPAVQGNDPPGGSGTTQLRQPSVRQPSAPVPRHRSGQHAGHDRQGEGRQSKGGEAPGSQADGRGRAGDEKTIRRGTGHSGRIVQAVSPQPAPGLWDRSEEVLEALRTGNWYVLHPSLNPTGTNTLRWSCSSPNEQNISKKGIDVPCKACGDGGLDPTGEFKCRTCKGEGSVVMNLRYCFGPAPGREWWSLDAKNIELRIPAYESGELELIELFENPDAPPYYGSNHMLIFHILHPDKWDAAAREMGEAKAAGYCKKKYADTWYQWTKNGNFAVQYGAVDREDGTGTADLAYHVPGAQRRIAVRFAKQDALNKRCIRFAEQHGYVETLPDRTVDPARGYPLMCTRTQWGRILPTVPLNYRVQGSAMWWTQKAMIRTDEQLMAWRSRDRYDGRISMQVHDELVFDLPKRAHPKRDPKRSNLGRVRLLQKLMEAGGDDIGIPTPVGVEFHEENWQDGVTF